MTSLLKKLRQHKLRFSLGSFVLVCAILGSALGVFLLWSRWSYAGTVLGDCLGFIDDSSVLVVRDNDKIRKYSFGEGRFIDEIELPRNTGRTSLIGRYLVAIDGKAATVIDYKNKDSVTIGNPLGNKWACAVLRDGDIALLDGTGKLFSAAADTAKLIGDCDTKIRSAASSQNGRAAALYVGLCSILVFDPISMKCLDMGIRAELIPADNVTTFSDNADRIAILGWEENNGVFTDKVKIFDATTGSELGWFDHTPGDGYFFIGQSRFCIQHDNEIKIYRIEDKQLEEDFAVPGISPEWVEGNEKYIVMQLNDHSVIYKRRYPWGVLGHLYRPEVWCLLSCLLLFGVVQIRRRRQRRQSALTHGLTAQASEKGDQETPQQTEEPKTPPASGK